ncbi:MAG: hypothetical protein E1N59_3188 [Puniceicoccaceae bacterium 5H]|nr:MAG: hypothetical protein E1N59_3188 [Puniceicoccaceae bacterium 5H]
MHPSNQLTTSYPLEVFLFASPVYWPDAAARTDLFAQVEALLSTCTQGDFSFRRVDRAEDLGDLTNKSQTPCLVVPLSGGVQPWMLRLSDTRDCLGLFAAYLPEAMPADLAGRLLHANAHPASTDFFASCRLKGKRINWLASLAEVADYAIAAQAATRLSRARLLKIGETEPWVINSCRSPQQILSRVHTEVIPLEREALYAVYHTVTDADAQDEADRWLAQAPRLISVQPSDILKACRVTVAMRQLLASHEADGLSMACFSMIGDLDTTSCLALSALNDSANAIGACEGDLDAALTLFLLKSLGADFVWIANPIVHANNAVDLVHCTAPTCACHQDLKFSLMRHHESGRGVSPEVVLPDAQVASIARISVNAQEMTCHTGWTERQRKLPACHTQIRLHVASSQAFLDTLLGTHQVLSYGLTGAASPTPPVSSASNTARPKPTCRSSPRPPRNPSLANPPTKPAPATPEPLTDLQSIYATGISDRSRLLPRTLVDRTPPDRLAPDARSGLQHRPRRRV